MLHVKENNNLNIKSADKVIFDYSWPNWNGEIPENTSAVFQGLLRNTKKIHDVCVSEGRDWYYFDQPYFFFSDYQQSITGDRWYRVCKNNTQKNYLEIFLTMWISSKLNGFLLVIWKFTS